MKLFAFSVFSLCAVIGLIQAAGYYPSYMPVPYYPQNTGGAGNGGFLALIGLIFIIIVIFGFNRNNNTSSPSFSVVDLDDK